jgi:shikimate dehydrogenase
VLGTGGAARAAADALRHVGADVRMMGRRDAGWPPSPDEIDVLVNATPVRDALIVEPREWMQVVDLAYDPAGTPTALVTAARVAGCDIVVDGLDVLLFQGVAAFERWTGLPAPLLAMREALRGTA